MIKISIGNSTPLFRRRRIANPSSLISGYDLQFDASVGVSSTTGVLSSWTDQVSGRIVTVPAGANGPRDDLETLNGTPVIDFNGTDQALQLADGTYSRQALTTNSTITYAVIKAPLDAAFNYILDCESNINRNACLYGVAGYGIRNAIDSLITGGTANKWHVVTFVNNMETQVSKIYVDGVLTIEDTSGNLDSSPGTGITLGSRADITNFGDFTLAELVEYTNIVEHTAMEVSENVAFLSNKWL